MSREDHIEYKLLLKYMEERHRIYLRRLEGQPRSKWTKDTILQEYSFCNVYRELDKVTAWIRENIREQYAEHPHLWFMLCIARQINWPDTLAELIADRRGAWPSDRKWDANRMRQIMDDRQARGGKVYTGAYMLTCPWPADYEGERSKSLWTTAHVLAPLWKDRAKICASGKLIAGMRSATELLGTYQGWGPFLAYEVACDLRYTRYLQNAPDVMTWANPGPGARRGIARLLGHDINSMATAPSYTLVSYMRELLDSINRKWTYQPLEMREIEHSLCEFDKYERVRLGQGRPRAKFHPSEE